MSDTDLYVDRRLAEGYPGLEQLAHEAYLSHLEKSRTDSGEEQRISKLLTYLNRIIDVTPPKKLLVVGCGPKPYTLELLLERGYDTIGIEPIPSFVDSGNEYLAAADRLLKGSAENVPLGNGSQDVVFLESVLEHVDSPIRCLNEIYRVLAPGSLLYVVTTNRYRFSIRGRNGEYNVKFYNWFPNLVKESLVFRHLHYEPHLANYTERPAVHWFSYDDLCRLGRMAGFAQFYSVLDVLRANDPSVTKSWWRQRLLKKMQHNPWLRACILTQIGGTIFMLKRPG